MTSRRFRRTRASALVAAAAVLAVSAAACSSSSSQSGAVTNSTLTVAAFNPFTGPDASFGPEMMAGCLTAAAAVNAAGGVLSNKVACTSVDTRGDPADAVTAGAKMLATTPHLLGVLGPSSDEADSTARLINAAKVTMFADTGEASFDHTKLQYFWRMTPGDDVLGYAMALYAKQKGYLRAAAVFGNDIGSQSVVPTLLKGYGALGGQMVLYQKIAQNQTSYQPEVQQLIAAKPQVIFTEAAPQSSATYLGELQQVSHLIPVVGSNATIEPGWLSAVAAAIGKPAMSKYYTGATPYAAASGPAWQAYNKVLLATPSVTKPASQWSGDGYSMVDYDGLTVMALAATAAKSTNPAVFNAYIPAVTTASPGAVVVHSYAGGLAALKAGKKIDYVGATGVIAWDKWHNSTGDFEIQGYQPNGSTPNLDLITAADVAPLLK
ncbi:MAG TPA: ABC transporter substrate-binding protein [Streptosporangiaceae bacterium]|nr:ABC transporter substrate-binding protein [Streptosporangiaceae bacterium]